MAVCSLDVGAPPIKTGKAQPVPTFEPRTEEELRVHDAAMSRIELRRAIETEMDKQTYDGPSEAPRMITRFLAKPMDVNWGGKVHGGTAMEWIDEAASACTMEWSGENTVAVYAGGIRFYRPIQIGDLIEVDARLLRTDARSMQVVVHVFGAAVHDAVDAEIEVGTVYLEDFPEFGGQFVKGGHIGSG